ncbi:hypothetical protein IJG89_02390 [Candidatus Saccharibacteria bacterium]|nr:hypothetical protein [Candidatus Saccharibacteria bacterium]
MDNYQLPNMPMGQDPQVVPSERPMAQQVVAAPSNAKDNSGLIKTIIIVVLSLVAVTFIGLFIWMFIQYSDASSNLQGQIDMAVAQAKDEQATTMEAEFKEREKNPYTPFTGPADYGQLTFEHPKTWSVYVASDASNGGDFEAFFNPAQVNPVSRSTINALRVVIRDKGFDDVAAEYQRAMDKKDSNLTMEAVTFGKNNDITGNRYTGTIPNTELNGFIVIFKIRDKTAILQTDSVLFQADFDRVLETVSFNA